MKTIITFLALFLVGSFASPEATAHIARPNILLIVSDDQGYNDLVIDGFNWWPVLRGETESPREAMFWKRKNRIAARVGHWKWVDMEAKSGGLFNLSKDPEESNDLSKKQPDILRSIQDPYQCWLSDMEAAEPRGPFRDF